VNKKVGSRKTFKKSRQLLHIVFNFLFMKRIRIAMAVLVLTVGLVASFAFTSKKNASTPLFFSTYYYDQAQSGIGITSYNIASLVTSELQDQGNWVTTQAVAFANGNNLAAIEFPEEANRDGSADGFLDKHEATFALAANKSSLNTTDGQVMVLFVSGSSGTCGNAAITIRKRQ
jgi:hypothetical protein